MPHKNGRTAGSRGGLRLEEAGGRDADAALMGGRAQGGSRPAEPGNRPGVLWVGLKVHPSLRKMLVGWGTA